MVSQVVALCIINLLYQIDYKSNYTIEDVINFWNGDEPEKDLLKFENTESLSSSILLTTLSVGLLLAYFYLIYNIEKYHKDRLIIEMGRLRALFAVFCLCYGLRALYTFGLGTYRSIIKSTLLRWHFNNCFPLIWDILPIVSVLIMHYLTFKPKRIDLSA